MSEAMELDKAKYEYRQFLFNLRGRPARTTKLYDTDPPLRPMENVPRKEVLEAFLRKHPEYRKFENELGKTQEAVHPIHVVSEEWDKVKK